MITLKMTSSGCPEQYSAYLGSEEVGFLHLRHGTFFVEFPASGGREIYRAKPQGDGAFEHHERDHYLRCAVAAIWEKVGSSVIEQDDEPDGSADDYRVVEMEDG